MKKSNLTKKIILSIILVFMFFMNFSVMKNVKADDVDDTQIVNNDYEETTELDDTTTDETEVVNTALPVFNNEQSDNSNDVQQDNGDGEPVVVVDGSDDLEVSITQSNGSTSNDTNNQIEPQITLLNNSPAPLLGSEPDSPKSFTVPAGKTFSWTFDPDFRVKQGGQYIKTITVKTNIGDYTATYEKYPYQRPDIEIKNNKIGPFTEDTEVIVESASADFNVYNGYSNTHYTCSLGFKVTDINSRNEVFLWLFPSSTYTFEIKKIWNEVTEEEENDLIKELKVNIYSCNKEDYDDMNKWEHLKTVTLNPQNNWSATCEVPNQWSEQYLGRFLAYVIKEELGLSYAPATRQDFDTYNNYNLNGSNISGYDDPVLNTSNVTFNNKIWREVEGNVSFIDYEGKPLPYKSEDDNIAIFLNYQSKNIPSRTGRDNNGYRGKDVILSFGHFPANCSLPGVLLTADLFTFTEKLVDKDNADITDDFFVTYQLGDRIVKSSVAKDIRYMDLPVSTLYPSRGVHPAIRQFSIINQKKKVTDYTVTKVWDDNDDTYDQRPESVSVQLYRKIDDGQFEKYKDPIKLTAKDNWEYKWENLHAQELNEDGEITENIVYYAKEVNVPDDYVSNYSYAEEEATKEKKELTITNQLITEHYTVTKVWEDYDNEFKYRPEQITVQLYKLNNDKQLVELGDPVSFGEDDVVEGHKWSHRWTNLPIVGVYYAKELDVSDNPFYEVSYSLSEQEIDEHHAHLTITNKLKIEKDKYKVDIKWDDLNDKYEIRPDEVTVQLYRKQAPVRRRMMLLRAAPPAVEFEPVGEPVTVSAADNWSHEWDLPTTYLNEDGVSTPIAYYVKQGDINKNYLTSYSPLEEEVTAENRAVTITNTLDTVEVSVNKIWDDNNNKAGVRPESVTVRLLADGKKTDETVTLTGRGSWKNIFTGLLKYNEEDKEIVYTVQEAEVKGYTSKVDGYTITNTYTPLPDGEDSGGVTTRTYTVPKTGVE
jgi:hypothetical protein